MNNLIKYLLSFRLQELKNYHCSVCLDEDWCNLLLYDMLPHLVGKLFTPVQMYQIHMAQIKYNDTRKLKWVRTEPGKITVGKLHRQIIKLISIS